MDLFLVRHAIAHDRDPNRWLDDADRPLSEEGEERFRIIAGDLARVSNTPMRLFSSPLVRAWRTAEILHEVAGWPEPEELDVLKPEFPPSESVPRVRKIAEESDTDEPFALVGHRPNLHELASCFLTGEPDGFFMTIKKGGSLCIRFDGKPDSATGDLRWLMTPKMSFS